MNDLIDKMYTNPKRIFNLPDQEVCLFFRYMARCKLIWLLLEILAQDTYVVVNMDDKWTIPKAMAHSKCAWTPFAGMQVQGRVVRVVLRGKTAMLDGTIFSLPGEGRNVCATRPRPAAPLALVKPPPVSAYPVVLATPQTAVAAAPILVTSQPPEQITLTSTPTTGIVFPFASCPLAQRADS